MATDVATNVARDVARDVARGEVPESVQSASLYAWHRGDSVTVSGGNVTAFADKSGNGRSLTQAIASRQPTYEAISVGGQPGADFDGTDYMEWASGVFGDLSGVEIFVAYRMDADPPPTTGTSGFWRMGSSGNSSHHPFTDSSIYDDFGSTVRKTVGDPAQDMTVPNVYDVISASSEWTAYINDTQIFTTATNTVGWPGQCLLGTNSSIGIFLVGRVAEVIAYDGKLSAADRAAVKEYLYDRYGITP